MIKFIMFLVRARLGLKKGERFQFANQKSEYDRYYFTSTHLIKECFDERKLVYWERLAHVKLNYILSKKCEIVKCNVPRKRCR